MGNLLRVPHQDRRDLRVNIKHDLQMLPVALQRGHGNHVVQYGSDHILFLGRRQRPLHDLRIIQHIVDLAGQALSGSLIEFISSRISGVSSFPSATSLIPMTMLMGVRSSWDTLDKKRRFAFPRPPARQIPGRTISAGCCAA